MFKKRVITGWRNCSSPASVGTQAGFSTGRWLASRTSSVGEVLWRLISIRPAVWVSLAVAPVALGVSSPALAAGHRPKGDYAPFANCPLDNPQTQVCIFAQTESGELAIGSRTIPLARTVTLQGGVHEDEASGKQEFIPSEGGEALSRTPQVIPGTLFTVAAPQSLPTFVQGIFNEFIDQRKPTNVTATTELAGPAKSIGIDTQDLIEAKGIGLSLPVKVKLSNPLLGERLMCTQPQPKA